MLRLSAGLAAWRASGRTFRHRGHDVFYRDEGRSDGGTLVLLHGFPTASWDWSSLWEPLTSRWRVVAADMIGYGFSDKPRPYPYSIADQADLIEGLLGELGVTQVHLFAHDVGDTVAQELLARHHLDIRSVCLLNGGLFPETHRATLRQRLLAGPLGPILTRLLDERAFSRSFSGVFAHKPSPTELQDFWQLVAWNDGHHLTHVLLGYIVERRRHRERWVGALRTEVPLVVINGSEDPVSGAHMVARLREEVPAAGIVDLPGVGHYPQVEAPDKVLAAYLAFRERLAAD